MGGMPTVSWMWKCVSILIVGFAVKPRRMASTQGRGAMLGPSLRRSVPGGKRARNDQLWRLLGRGQGHARSKRHRDRVRKDVRSLGARVGALEAAVQAQTSKLDMILTHLIRGRQKQ